MTPADARHRHPDGARVPRETPTWVRLALGAVAVLVAIAAVIAAAAAAAPHVPTPAPIAAAPTSYEGRTSGTRVPRYPPAVIPTIGASGAWDPDAGIPTPTSSPPAAPSHCSRCGEREPIVTSTPPATASQSTSPPPRAPAATPQPGATTGLLELVNVDRLANGCGPVLESASLTSQSQAWSEQQARDDFMHHSPGVSGFDTWSENVAAGYDTAAAVHDAWMASPDHRANVLDCSFIYLGFGAADSATGIRYWTEQFAA